MKDIVFKDNKVLHILDKLPIGVSEGVKIARCEYIPKLNLGEYHEVYNVQEHIETYTEKEPKEVKKVDELTNEEYIDTEYVDVQKQRPYKTCELRVRVNEKAVKTIRLRKLKAWFDNEYREAFEKFTRWKALGKQESVFDETFNVLFTTIDELFVYGERVREEIKALKEELKLK